LQKSKSENGGVVMEIVSYCSTSGDARFTCAQAGCRDCVEALLYENSGLAWTMIARQLPGNAEYADLYQEARLGLWRAILYFDTSRGIRFSTFACIAIWRGVRRAVERSWKPEGWLEANRAGDSLELLLRVWQASGDRIALWANRRRAANPGEDWTGLETQPRADPPTQRGSAGAVEAARILDPFANYL
jgi:hypothetical protein